MSNPVEQFLLKTKEDVLFMQQISAMKTREEVIEAAKVHGIQLTFEDIDAINEALKQESLKNIPKDTPAGQFINKLIEDKNFAELVMSQTEVEEILRIAEEAGIALTAENVSQINSSLAAMSDSAPAKASNVELSEEDLEQVAGGTLFTITQQLPVTLTYTISAPPPFITTYNPPMTITLNNPITLTLNDPSIIK